MIPESARAAGAATCPSGLAEPAAYLSPAQVAQLLQVSEKSVYRWAKADPSMPMLKIGGTVRFHRERLERWLRSREQGTPMRRQVRSLTESSPSGTRSAPCADGVLRAAR
jgi:excisionase family DNA binding protein